MPDQTAGRPGRTDRGVDTSRAGALAFVLHTHLPYVEGFGTWPFGEERLWEAASATYRPLLDLLERHSRGPAVTVSVTPVLADQLEARGVAPRFDPFLNSTRELVYGTEIDDLRRQGLPGEAAALEFLRGRYRAASRPSGAAIRDLARDLVGVATWTSSATHAILPLVATPEGLRAQLGVGVEGHRRRSGD